VVSDGEKSAGDYINDFFDDQGVTENGGTLWELGDDSETQEESEDDDCYICW